MLEPAGLPLVMLLLPSLAPSLLLLAGAVLGRCLPVSALDTFLLGFLFSLAKIDCLATKEILCCLGDEDPGAGVAAVDDALDEVLVVAIVDEV